ncbi:MAG: OmpA family protein [Desulfovibrionaceae bacterium]
MQYQNGLRWNRTMKFSATRPHLLVLWLVALALLLPAATNSMAADLPGSKDHPLIKRFGGSEIVGYDVKRFDEYELQTSTFQEYDTKTKRRKYVQPPLQLEGSVTRLWYLAAGDASAAELVGNYRNELTSQGFRILYESSKDPNFVNRSNFLSVFGSVNIKASCREYVFLAADKDKARVLSAIKEQPEGNVYVYVTAVEWAGDDPVYTAKKGAYAAVDIVEVKPMQQNMVVVKADQMAKDLSGEGRVALYGIFFDTDSAVIKAESKPTLEEIAKLLRQDTALMLHVVGHTDNVGGFEHNIELSKRRASSVKDALVNQYGIAADRLTPNGVAYLAPIAANTTEEGRAKNRRVELVPR